MKQFDFNHPCFFRHQPRRRELLKRLYKSGATEDEFVKANREIVKLNGKVYSRSRLRPFGWNTVDSRKPMISSAKHS
jgi:hypothetical protein